MKTNMGCGTALSYIFMVAVIDYFITSYLLNQVDTTSYGSGLHSAITFWFFSVPAFLLGFALFCILDWGLKHIWYQRSPLALLPILVVLAIPFIWEYFALGNPITSYSTWQWDIGASAISQHNILIPIAISVTMLLWSGFIVFLKIWFE